jgi:hypothetical protein
VGLAILELLVDSALREREREEWAKVWSAVSIRMVCLLFLNADSSMRAITDDPPSRPQHTQLQCKLYLQPTSDNPTHGEMLSSLFTISNMLDLGLM